VPHEFAAVASARGCAIAHGSADASRVWRSKVNAERVQFRQRDLLGLSKPCITALFTTALWPAAPASTITTFDSPVVT
jgi:hypothetical protein